jgi:hypothetical protein
MVDIVVSDELAREILARSETVRIRDAQGRVLFALAPRPGNEPDDVGQMRRALASDQPRYTTEQVLNHLRSLSDQ